MKQLRFNRRDVSTFLLCMIISFPTGWLLRELGIDSTQPVLRFMLQVPMIAIGVGLTKLAFKRFGLGAVVGWERRHDR